MTGTPGDASAGATGGRPTPEDGLPALPDSSATVLVVDDDLAKRYLLHTWLRRAGHTVIEADTGREALELAPSADLILLDVNLPDITGFDVCRQIKTDPRTAAIPVIQVSATAVAVADRAHGLTQGADAYLTDPSEPDELLAVVAAVLRYYRARRRAEQTASMLAALTRATLAINAADTFDGLARAAATGAARIFGVEAVLHLQMPDGQVRRTSASPAGSETVQRGGPADLVDRVIGLVLNGGEANAAVTVAADAWRNVVPDSTLRGDVCLAAARTKPGRPPVALALTVGGVPGEQERQILRQFVQAAALAVEALRSYAEEHVVALTLQRSFLPTGLPTVPGLAMASRYIPASDQAEVGGDFYEALHQAGQDPGGHRRCPGPLAARGHGHGRTPARAARLRGRGTLAGRHHRPGQPGPDPLSPGHHRHLVPGRCWTWPPAICRSSTAGTCRSSWSTGRTRHIVGKGAFCSACPSTSRTSRRRTCRWEAPCS